jgi:hypothetical protein
MPSTSDADLTESFRLSHPYERLQRFKGFILAGNEYLQGEKDFPQAPLALADEWLPI